MSKIPVLTLAAALLSFPFTASATFIAAWHDFDNGVANEAPDINDSLGGLSADLDKVTVNLVTGNTSGGSGDKTFGPGFVQYLAGVDNGFISMRDGTTLQNTIQQIVVQLTNNTSLPMYLLSVAFDAIAQNAGSSASISVGWRLQGGGAYVPVGAGTTGLIPSTGGSNWSDYIFNSSNGAVTFQPGETIEVRFASPAGAVNGVNIDNIAFTVIPEPANMLGLGALICSGLGMRFRRRKAVTA